MSGEAKILFTVVVTAVVVLAGWTVWRMRPSARRARRYAKAVAAWDRDMVLAREWGNLWEVESRSPRRHVARIDSVYASYPRRGTKALLTWASRSGVDEVWQDTWFEQLWPRQGMWIAVEGGSGYGPHNHNPDVFYVRQVFAWSSDAASAAYARCAAANWQRPSLTVG